MFGIVAGSIRHANNTVIQIHYIHVIDLTFSFSLNFLKIFKQVFIFVICLLFKRSSCIKQKRQFLIHQTTLKPAQS